MKRRDFLTRAGAGAALAATAAPVIGQAPQVRWRMSTMWPKSLDAMHGSAEIFARRVGELAEGRFSIQATAAGEIVPPPQVFDAVQNGTIECGHVLSSFFFGKNPAFGFDAGMPFGLNARQQAAWMYYGGGLAGSARGVRQVQHRAVPGAATSACRWAAGTARRSTASTT